MADYTAIYSVGYSLAQYLSLGFAATPLQQQHPNVKFQLVSSSQIAEEDQTALDQVVTVFLHRITLDDNFRSATHIQDDPNKKALLYLNLHYLITYWGTDVQVEQTILGWTMQQLRSVSVLDNSILTPAGIWDPTESIQLVPADLSLEDILRIWDALGPKYRLSLCYIARVLRIDVSRQMAPEPLVIANRFQYEEKGTAL